jgi:hypothetical protein
MPTNLSNPPYPSYRKTAIVVGILFIVCSAASVLSALPTHSLLDAPDYLNQLAAHDDRVIFGAILELIWAITGAGIAVALYPVLRRYNEGRWEPRVAGSLRAFVLVAPSACWFF